MENIVPLSSQDIDGYAKDRYKNYYRGTFEIIDGKYSPNLYSDIQHNNLPLSIYFILLLKKDTNLGHWTFLFVVNKNGKTGIYYDPMGMMSFPPSFVKLFDTFKFNSNVIQIYGDERCGLHVLREANMIFRPAEHYAEYWEKPPHSPSHS